MSVVLSEILCYICCIVSNRNNQSIDDFGKYDLISAAYRSRLLYRTEAEYRDVLGVTFETIVNKRDSERDMDVYYGILNRESERMYECGLDDLVMRYIMASDFYLNVDWGDRFQMASRRRFCRMLFRFYATVGRGLSGDEIFEFKTKDADGRLIKEFFPNGTDGEPAVDVGIIMLFAYDVLRPWDANSSRGRDMRDEDTVSALEHLRGLLEQACDDTPCLGSTEKPMVFVEWLSLIAEALSEPDDLSGYTSAWMIASLADVADACRRLLIPEKQRIGTEQMLGLDMSGIWVDDADCGDSRFWVFPDNISRALCFRSVDGKNWEMLPYDFRVRVSDSPEYNDWFLLLRPEADRAYTLCPDRVIGADQVAIGFYEYDYDEVLRGIVHVKLFEGARRFAPWLDWRNWTRLAADDVKYKEFREVLTSVFDVNNAASMTFKNVAREITDGVNNMMGSDRKYLYVYDWRPDRFMITEDEPGVFVYKGADPESVASKALFELDVTECHPLYAIPRCLKRANHANAEVKRLADILKDSDNIRDIIVTHSNSIKHPRLVLPSYGFTIGLDMDELAPVGVIKFTSNPFVSS